MPSQDWSHEEYHRVVATAFFVDRKNVVTLDVERATRRNMDEIIAWAKADGYIPVEINSDAIQIKKG